MNILFLEDSEGKTFLTEYLRKQITSSAVIITDDNTKRYCMSHFLEFYPKEKDYIHINISPGEKEKNLNTATRIWDDITEKYADRKTLFINLGGGVITDLGGFVASLYKRGCPFIHIPTTVLSMVDAAVGGKNGVDLKHIKNIIGTINNPELTVIDPFYIDTLPEEDIKSGWAEIIKHALIGDIELWNDIKHQNPAIAPNFNILKRAVAVKQKIVENDPHENGLRKTLNYGHTVGHALESYLLDNKAPIKHGHAVIFGIILENRIAVKKGILEQEIANEIEHFINPHYSLDFKYNVESLINLALHDKKNKGNSIRLALIDKIGHGVYDIPCSEEELREVLA